MRKFLRENLTLLVVISLLVSPAWAQVVSQTYGLLAYRNTVGNALGVASGTSVALGGCTIAANALCATGTGFVSGTFLAGSATSQGVYTAPGTFVGAYTDPSAGGGAAAQESVFSNSAAAAGVGGVTVWGGATGNAFTPYAFAGVKGSKKTGSGDADYSGIMTLYTTTSGGTFTSRMTINETGAVTFLTGGLTVASATMITTTTAFTNGAAAAAGTITNAPSIGNPTKWIPVNDNGTTRYIPAW